MQKKQLRERLRRDRATSFAPDTWLQVLASEEVKAATVVASYISYGTEPETGDLNQALLASGKKLLLPRLLKDNDLEWVQWNGATHSLAKNGKVSEPAGAKFSDEAAINVVIVPTLAIDRTGVRLGQGGGSYDRALSRLGSSCWKVGLIYAVELSATPLPSEVHDQKLDAAATPHLITRFYHEH